MKVGFHQVDSAMTKVEDNLFFRDFSRASREALLKCATTTTFQAGQTIFLEGDPSDGLRLVLDGSVEIIKAAGAKQQTLAIYKAGDYFGEVSVLDGGGRSTSARAQTEVTLLTIPRQEFLDTLAREPVPLTINMFKRVLEELRRADALFISEVLKREKLSFVGEMANSLMHDLRNPLTGIGLASELITLRHDDPQTAKSCESIRLQCSRVTAMAQELLDFSRDEMRLQLGNTTTTALLEQFCVLHEDLFKRADVLVEAKAEPADIRVDAMRLWRLLQNLVNNAMEALEGRPGARVTIFAWVTGEILHLTVADNGPGIPENVRSRLFEPFVTEGKARGTGLGLSIVRNIVVSHGGSIDLKTSPTEGTTWIIEVPQHSKTQQLPLPRKR